MCCTEEAAAVASNNMVKIRQQEQLDLCTKGPSGCLFGSLSQWTLCPNRMLSVKSPLLVNLKFCYQIVTPHQPPLADCNVQAQSGDHPTTPRTSGETRTQQHLLYHQLNLVILSFVSTTPDHRIGSQHVHNLSSQCNQFQFEI